MSMFFYTVHCVILNNYFVYYKYMNHGEKQSLKKVLPLKQHFTKHIKMLKDINIKHRGYYFVNNMIDLKDFDGNKFKIGQEKLQAHWYL